MQKFTIDFEDVDKSVVESFKDWSQTSGFYQEQGAKKKEELKKTLEEKYALTPAEIEHNKMVKLGKQWGTNTTGVEITPYTKAKEAGEVYAWLIGDDEESRVPEIIFPTLTRLTGPSLFGQLDFETASKEDIIKGIKSFKKDHPDEAVPFTEKTLEKILDRFPDIFDETDVELGEKDADISNPMRDKIFTEFAMEAPHDCIKYIKPVFSVKGLDNDLPNEIPAVVKFNNVDTGLSNDVSAMTVLENKLRDRVEDNTPVKPEKLSWKKQQRIKNKNPLARF